jgi:pimeloyl-ACP methyl ester carboxylesterase
VPTLVITGTFDGRTSPQWGAYAASTLANSTEIALPGIGHWVTAQNECAQTVLRSFLADPFAPDTSCVASVTPPDFVVTDLPR